MQRLQAFKYELMPHGEQQCHMRRFARSCRFVFSTRHCRFCHVKRDGSYVVALNILKRQQQALAKAQRAMSRKQKFSNNWKKAKAEVQTIHARIGNARRDYLHKTSISQNHAIVCIEDLQVRNMSKSASGTAETPGNNVRASGKEPTEETHAIAT